MQNTELKCLPLLARVTEEKRKNMTKRADRPHDEAMAELYADDPDFAIEVINSILEDGDQAELLILANLRALLIATNLRLMVANKFS